MLTSRDYFFGPFVTPQAQRLRFVARNGVTHASAITPNDPLPDQPVTLSALTDAALPIDRVAAYYTTDGSEPLGACGQAERGAVALATAPDTDVSDVDGLVGDTQARRWRIVIPGQPDGALVRYRIDAWNSADPLQRWLADAEDPIGSPAPAGREFAYHVDRRAAPDWVHDAIIYQIFVDRFADATGATPAQGHGDLTAFSGGALRGITQRLDYLAGLGVNCLWLSPIMDSPSYHSYNPTSFHDVSHPFGSNDDLRELIAAVHTRGMRILLDFVANHTSNEHAAFVAAQRDQTALASSWYTFDQRYPNGYLSFFNVEGMPVLNTESAAVRDYLVEAARYWLSDLGADGVRLDNVSGPTHAFWTDFQERVKQTNPNALTLGEVTGDITDITTYAGRLDTCMDFPLTREMRRTFALRETSLTDLLDYLAWHDAKFPARMTPARLLDNHDMHRFLWLAGDDTRRLKLALAFLMALTGVPILYYGTEVGLSQRAGPSGQDAYAREPMLWDGRQRTDVLEHTRWLIARRVERASLRRGRMARVSVTTSGAPEQVGALARWSGAEATIAIFNNSETTARVVIDPHQLPFALAPGAPANGSLLTPDGRFTLTGLTSRRLAGEMAPMSAAYLFLEISDAEAREGHAE